MTLNEKLNLIQTHLKAPKSQFNKFGGYAYRSCEDILEALKPLLSETKTALILSDTPILVGDRFYIEARAELKDSESNETIIAKAYAREPLTKKGMDEAQITGATSSYARKYALNGLFAIDDTKDADFTNTHDKDEPKSAKTLLNSDQKAELSELIELTNTDFSNFLAYFKAKDLSEVPFDKAKSMLLTKFNQQKETK